jgi:gliding motility-associated-like protein
VIANPVARYNSETDMIRYRVLVYNEAECVDSAFLNVKVFQTIPSIFVPSALSPNDDGHNDFLRPIAVGMQKIEYFNVYTRWGQLVYSSILNGRGWDGRIGGKVQNAQTFVWMVKALDYKGGTYFQKGTVTLIR